jgi:hypothetical protein
MKSKGSGRRWSRSLVEVVAMLAASTIMALMVVGGGIAAESTTPGQSPAIEETLREVPPLSPREST